MKAVHEKRLYEACQLLFGHKVDVSRDFLSYIQPSGIKSAYRKMALQTHPDRFTSEGEDAPDNDMFIETNQAYELLTDFVNARDRGEVRMETVPTARQPREPKTSRRRRRKTRKPKKETFYTGNIPNRGLLFGQYLFYSGKVSWESLIRAIVWQRSQRPRIGEIAIGWKLLSDWQFRLILVKRQPGELMGEAAIRICLLKQAQVNALLYHQRRLQKPFGQYFLINNILSRSELQAILTEFIRHNTRQKGFGSNQRYSN
jgi:curved DNA-binding protein CbpA